MPRTEKSRVRAGKSSFPSSPAASSAKPCKVGGRSGERETENGKPSAAPELFVVVVVFFFFFSPSLSGLLLLKVSCKGNDSVRFLFVSPSPI